VLTYIYTYISVGPPGDEARSAGRLSVLPGETATPACGGSHGDHVRRGDCPRAVGEAEHRPAASLPADTAQDRARLVERGCRQTLLHQGTTIRQARDAVGEPTLE
jgi:hypothetical protein